MQPRRPGKRSSVESPTRDAPLPPLLWMGWFCRFKTTELAARFWDRRFTTRAAARQALCTAHWGPHHSPGRQTHHQLSCPDEKTQARQVERKGIAEGTVSKRRSWDSNLVKCTQPWPQATKKLLGWNLFFFFLKIKRNERVGRGEKKRKRCVLFFTFNDYLKSPCSCAHGCPLPWNTRSLKGPCAGRPTPRH